MLDFIRLQLKLKWGFNKNNDKKSAIMTAVATFLALAVSLALVWVLTFVLKQNLVVPGSDNGVTVRTLAVMYLTLVLAGLTFAAVGMQVKRLYKPADLLITARFPLSPFKLFVGCMILNYIDLTLYSAIAVLPVMIVFGWAAQSLGFVYILGVLLAAILMPLVPFALSTFIAIPVMFVISLLDKHRVVRLVVFVVFLVGCFVLYDYILTVLAQFFIHNTWTQGTLDIWQKVLVGLDGYYNPAFWLSHVMFFTDKFWLNLGILLGASAVVIAGGIATARLVYSKVRTKALDGGYDIGVKRTALDGYGSARAMLRYGLKDIIRTKTYSYFYLGVAISTPVMVFFCNRLVDMVGTAQVGDGVNFGASMLVLTTFMAMICSFSGTLISSEGKNFYITKILPISYRKQLCIKGFLHIAVSVVALLISAILLVVLDFVSVGQMAILVATQIVLVFGLVLNGINLNLANPNLKPKANGEPEEINITIMLLIGLVIAAIMGAISLIFPFAMENGGMLAAALIPVGVSVVYAVINALVFWFTANEKYRKVE